MASVPISAISSSQVLVRIGNGGSPEQFIHPCLINTSRGIEFGSNTVDSLIPYCPPDEDLPGWLSRAVDSLTATVTGAGTLDVESLHIIWDWYSGGLSKNVHVDISTPLSEGGGYWYGKARLSRFRVDGPGRLQKAQFDCTIISDGAWAWTNASAGGP